MKKIISTGLTSLFILLTKANALAYSIDKNLVITQNTTIKEAYSFYQTKYNRLMTTEEQLDFYLIHSAIEHTMLGVTDTNHYNIDCLNDNIPLCGSGTLDIQIAGTQVSSNLKDQGIFFWAPRYTVGDTSTHCYIRMESNGPIRSDGGALLKVNSIALSPVNAYDSETCNILQDYFQDKITDGKLKIRFKKVK